MLNTVGITITAFIDNDRDKQSKGVEKLECISVEEMAERGAKDAVILISPKDDVKIRKQLEGEGLYNMVAMEPY